MTPAIIDSRPETKAVIWVEMPSIATIKAQVVFSYFFSYVWLCLKSCAIQRQCCTTTYCSAQTPIPKTSHRPGSVSLSQIDLGSAVAQVSSTGWIVCLLLEIETHIERSENEHRINTKIIAKQLLVSFLGSSQVWRKFTVFYAIPSYIRHSYCYSTQTVYSLLVKYLFIFFFASDITPV